MSALLAHAKAAEAYAEAWKFEAGGGTNIPNTSSFARVHAHAAKIMRELIRAEALQDGLNPINGDEHV